jgi:hypothetical protein
MKLKINVTKTDIKRGKRDNRYSCPIARAFQRATGAEKVSVGMFQMHRADKMSVDVPLPPEAKEFVTKFDFKGRQSVKPFSFEVEIPDSEVTKKSRREKQ